MADDVVVAQGLAKEFGATRALDGIDLRVSRGEVVGLLGHNGAGKTTAVRLLNGVLAPTAGHVRVLGLDPVAEGAALRRRTGVLTETPATDERLTGRENLRYAGDVHGLADVPGRVARLLADFELAEAADRRVKTYSKGMRQRLALARTILHEPELLFLDEPTSGLDPVAANAVHRLVERLAREERRTVVLCTHNLAEAARLCDRVVVLRRGRVVAEGAPRALAASHGGPRALAVEVEPATRAAAERALGAYGQVTARGDALEVADVDPARVPDAVAALVAAGARVRRVAPHEATLEEFYLALEKGAQEAHA